MGLINEESINNFESAPLLFDQVVSAPLNHLVIFRVKLVVTERSRSHSLKTR